jgi:hypothetical protein
MYETEAGRTKMYEAERQHIIDQMEIESQLEAEYYRSHCQSHSDESESRTEMCDSDEYHFDDDNGSGIYAHHPDNKTIEQLVDQECQHDLDHTSGDPYDSDLPF